MRPTMASGRADGTGRPGVRHVPDHAAVGVLLVTRPTGLAEYVDLFRRGSQPLARDYRASSMVVIVSTQQRESLMSAVDLDKDGGLDESVLSGRAV